MLTGAYNLSVSIYSGTLEADNLEPHILSIVGCPLWRGCNGKTIGSQKLVRYVVVSVIEECPLRRFHRKPISLKLLGMHFMYVLCNRYRAHPNTMYFVNGGIYV